MIDRILSALLLFFKVDPRGWKLEDDVFVRREGRDEYFVTVGQTEYRLVAEMGTKPDRLIYRSDVKRVGAGTCPPRSGIGPSPY